ncbi:hypothetical protein Tco_0080177 [Tanacetum coccineum]
MKNQSDVQNHLVEIQADDHDLLVNYDNENDDMLGYESEKYSDDEDSDRTNHDEDADETNHFRSKTRDLRYFDVDLTVRKLVMHRLGKLLRNFRMKLREKYILPNLNTPSKLNELPAKYSAIEKSARGKMERSKNVYHQLNGDEVDYVFVEIEMKKRERSLDNNSYVEEYDCSSLALD